MKCAVLRSASVLAPAILALVVLAQDTALPTTPQRPVTDTYHGQKVVDPFRWLEDASSRETQAWVAAQNKHAQRYLDGLDSLPRIRKRLEVLLTGDSAEFRDIQHAGGVTGALRDGSLVVLKSLDNAEPARTLIDVDSFNPPGSANIDLWMLSPDGRLAAASVSRHGTEEGTLHVYETATGKKRPDTLPGAYAPVGGILEWKPDSTGFYYSRYPHLKPGAKPDLHTYSAQEIWLHELGQDPAQDRYIFGRELPRYAQCGVLADPDGPALVLNSSTGYGAEGQSFFLYQPGARLRTLTTPDDRVANVRFGPKGVLLLESCKDAPRGQLLKLDRKGSLKQAEVLVPQGEGVISLWLPTDRFVYVVDRKDGSDRLRVFDMTGKEQKKITLPPHSSVHELAVLKDDQILYLVNGFFHPPTWMHHDPATGQSRKIALSENWAVKYDDCEVIREEVASADGTRVPLTILRRKDVKLDGERPVLLSGYGGSKEHVKPDFLIKRRPWFDRGGVWAIAHTRGEGELGEEWFRAALRDNRQRSRDDVLACAEHLIAKKYTKPGRIALYGGSHGGLLVGMALTERPNLFGAAVIDCGVLDLLRLETEPFGPHTTSEYGTVVDPVEFKAMLALSPVHRVRERAQYPAVFLRTGENDRRVSAWHSWKMAARLQASGSPRPVLVKTSANEGHQFSASGAEELAFLVKELGVKEEK